MVTGILSLQGAFEEHEKVLDELEEPWFEIRNAMDLDREMDGLILPGGESTVQGKLLNDLGMMTALRERIQSGLPVLGTCAGAILLAEKIYGDSTRHLGTLPAVIRRNAYGRQLGSFSARGDFGEIKDIPMEFIRAPYFEEVYNGTEMLSAIGGKTVAVRYGNQIATSFHPELTGDNRVHKYFLESFRLRTPDRVKL
ncbi:MAG: pyridoxal 5'-phosphate synthase glutaminase subunit PdxT [Candidatus Methanomethylophilaceae archaeon]|nr:pyridoxal 5'-phosphate synthase glutaminase subunit PdxT [Candidatus Methanomethylophilaceae archaeon]